LATALKTANLKSEEAGKWQKKYETLRGKIVEKRQNKMFKVTSSNKLGSDEISQPESVADTPLNY
jgi:hypothetical protein